MEWKLGAAIVVTAGIFAIAFGQVSDNRQHLKPVILNVTATDHAGHPVTDLKPGDLRVLDDGSGQQVTSLRLNPANPSPALVILFDLLDLNFQQAGYEAGQLRKSLAAMTTSEPLYLYVLVGNGTLYPVHAVPASDAPRLAGNAEWIENAGPSLKQVLEKVSRARSVEFISHPDQRFKATYSVLDSVRQELSRIHGRKQLLWITDGIPSSIRFFEGWVDLAPRLRQLGAQFNRDEIAIYTLDPSLALGTLNRDGLEVLSAATGGRALITSDLKMAITRARMDASASYELEYGPLVAENAEGRFHSVRISCNRKDVRIVYEGAYLAEAEPVKAAAVATALEPAPVMRAIPPEPVHTFVGLVRTVDSQSMVLELDDTRSFWLISKESRGLIRIRETASVYGVADMTVTA